VTKSELISKIAQKNPNLTLKEVEKIVSVVFAEIVDALSAGHRVEFRGFGAFSVRSRAPRTAKNPKTGHKSRLVNVILCILRRAKNYIICSTLKNNYPGG